MTAEFVAWFDGWWQGKSEGANWRRARALAWAIWQELKESKG